MASTGKAGESFRDRQRLRLREVTETVLAAEGLSAAQARRIAQEAGCSVGTLYNIYGDIDQLILAANATTLHDLARALTSAANSAEARDLKGRLMALALAYLEFATADTLRWRAVFEQRLADDYPVPTSYLEDRSHLLALIENELATKIPAPAARNEAARAMFSAVHGIVLLALDMKLGSFDREGCARQVVFVVGNVVRGLGRLK